MNTDQYHSKIASSSVIYRPIIKLLNNFLKSDEINFEFNRNIEEIKYEIRENKEIIKYVIFYFCDFLRVRNIVKSRKVILGTSIYYSCSGIPQYIAAEIINISTASIRALSKIIGKKNQVDIQKIIIKTLVRRSNRFLQNFSHSNPLYDKIYTMKKEVLEFQLHIKNLIKLIHLLFYKRSILISTHTIISCALYLSCPNISLYDACVLTKSDILSVENILKLLQKKIIKSNRRILALFQTMVKKSQFIKGVETLRKII